MTALHEAAEEYLAMRRSLGFKLTSQGSHLMRFIDYCDARGAEHITTEMALDWATRTSKRSADGVYWSRRLMVVRIFARHLQTLDPATEVPSGELLPNHKRRIAPYLYSAEEIAALMSAADRLTPPLRAATWRTLIGLLAVTGMRKSEACHLDRHDVDLDAGVLLIADSKFGKSRQVFLRPSTVTALQGYQQVRDRWCPAPNASSFFVSTRGTRLDAGNVGRAFPTLLDTAGICAPGNRRRPRVHDVRHTFAVASLLDLYRDGGDVQARLPLLTTWLGHVDPKSTYWYLQAVPELLALAAGRLEQAFPFAEPPA